MNEVTGSGTVPYGFTVKTTALTTGYGNSSRKQYKIFFFVTNNTGSSCDSNYIKVKFLDGDGNVVDDSIASIEAFEDGSTVVERVVSYVPFESFTYTFTTSTQVSYIPIDSDLLVEVEPEDDKATVTVTNNGSYNAMFPKFYMFFFKDDELVYDNYAYVMDSDDEIKTGASESKSCSCSVDYDEVLVFVHARADDD